MNSRIRTITLVLHVLICTSLFSKPTILTNERKGSASIYNGETIQINAQVNLADIVIWLTTAVNNIPVYNWRKNSTNAVCVKTKLKNYPTL